MSNIYELREEDDQINQLEDLTQECEETPDLSIKPLTVFGLLTDVQYADIDDGYSYDQLHKRYYRNSLNLVKEAVTNWKQYELNNGCKFQFLIQLGDLVDGKSKKAADSINCMNKCLAELNRLFEDEKEDGVKVLHIWGNHEFYCFKRSEITKTALNTAFYLKQNLDTNANYYVYDVSEKLRLICLDFYEMSGLGYEEDDAVYKKSMSLLKAHNKNDDLNSVLGMRGHAQRFSLFNGALSDKQTKWFDEQLRTCKEQGLKAIVCAHLPIHAQASDLRCLAWNSKELLDLIWSYGHTVIAYFAGHDHQGGYFRDKHNIHHITFAAILETPPNSNAYSTVKVYDNKVSVEGVGVIGYYEIYFD